MSSDRNAWLESLKVTPDVQANLDAVSRNYSNKATTSPKNSSKDSGRERGDNGPGKQGRESGLKYGNKAQINNCKKAIQAYQAKNTNGTKSTNSVQSASKSTHGNLGSHGVTTGNPGGRSGGIHVSSGNGSAEGSHGGTGAGPGGISGGHGGATGGGHGGAGGGGHGGK